MTPPVCRSSRWLAVKVALLAGLQGLCAFGAEAQPTAAHGQAVLPAEVVIALQPLRAPAARPTDWAVPLRPIAQYHAKGRYLQACQQSEALRGRLMKEASRLFYGQDRKQADYDGIERFLDSYVRGRTPVLEIPTEVFAPAAPWRALAVDACVRAGEPEKALRFVADAGSAGQDATSRVALAVVLAQKAGSWQAALPVLIGQREGVRVLLLRALAAGPNGGKSFYTQADRAALLPEERALVTLVGKTLGLQP